MARGDLVNGAYGGEVLHRGQGRAAGGRRRSCASSIRKGPRGPLALVADPNRGELAQTFKALTADDRPVEVFRSIHEARKWLAQFPVTMWCDQAFGVLRSRNARTRLIDSSR